MRKAMTMAAASRQLTRASQVERLMTAVSRPRAYQGWPLLAAGFRPFFLLGSVYAGLCHSGLAAGVLR